MPITSQEVGKSWTAHCKKLRWAIPDHLFLTISCKAFHTSFLLEWLSLILQYFYLALAQTEICTRFICQILSSLTNISHAGYICPRLKDTSQIAEEFASLSVKEKQVWWSFWKLSILVLAPRTHLSLSMQRISLFWAFVVWCYFNLGGFLIFFFFFFPSRTCNDLSRFLS